MRVSLHSRLDPEALAAGDGRLSGRFDAGELDARMADALAMESVAGEVHYELDFARAADRGIAVSGHLHARLVARCQRCLEPFELKVVAAPRVLIPVGDTTVQSETSWESTEAGEPASLVALIEDELLLALPFAPRHPERDCPAGRMSAARRETPTQRPFDGLAKALKAGRRQRK